LPLSEAHSWNPVPPVNPVPSVYRKGRARHSVRAALVWPRWRAKDCPALPFRAMEKGRQLLFEHRFIREPMMSCLTWEAALGERAPI
jgi:hypothetical protein